MELSKELVLEALGAHGVVLVKVLALLQQLNAQTTGIKLVAQDAHGLVMALMLMLVVLTGNVRTQLVT